MKEWLSINVTYVADKFGFHFLKSDLSISFLRFVRSPTIEKIFKEVSNLKLLVTWIVELIQKAIEVILGASITMNSLYISRYISFGLE
jgi:hypothetical protein